MNRRQFLRFLSLSGAASSLGPFSACGRSPEGPGRAVVVGAGLAGLTAAYELDKQGWFVTVLEARERPGGRVHTIDEGFSESQHAESGGELIDAPHVHTEMHHYIDAMGLSVESVGYEEVDGVYQLGDQRIRFGSENGAFDEGTLTDIDLFWDELELLAGEMQDPSSPNGWSRAANMDTLTVADWLDDLDLGDQARILIDHHVRAEYDEPSHISMLFLVQQAANYLDVEDIDRENYRVSGGNSRLAHALAGALSMGVEYGVTVDRIVHDDEGVVVHHSGGKVEADYVIVTTPIPVLDRIDFSPELPTSLRSAGAQMNYASHMKVLVQFTQRFWYSDGESGDVISDDSIGWFWEATDQQSGMTGILVGYASGEHAEALAELDDDEVIEQALTQLEALYPGARDRYVAGSVHVWKKEDFSRGGFAAWGLQQLTAWWDELRSLQGRVVIAGEHTDVFTGYMEGAVRSGQRAVRQISPGGVVGSNYARTDETTAAESTQNARIHPVRRLRGSSRS